MTISQLENNEVRYNLHNLIVLRGRLSSMQASMLKEFKSQTLQLIERLEVLLIQ